MTSETKLTCQECGSPLAVYGNRLVCLLDTCARMAPLPPAYEVKAHGGLELPGFGEREDG